MHPQVSYRLYTTLVAAEWATVSMPTVQDRRLLMADKGQAAAFNAEASGRIAAAIGNPYVR